MSAYRHILYTLFIALLATSCSKEDEPKSHIPSNAVYDFVTLVESSKSYSVFEFRKNDDEPVITYTSKIDLASASTHVSVGDRVIICYTMVDGEVYTTGDINLYAYATLANTQQALQIGKAEEFGNWTSGPFEFEAIWRSGQYINMQVNLFGYKSLTPKLFVIVADEATIDDEFPELHLIYANRDENEGVNKYDVNASFDISEVWDRPSCHGVTIYYPTTTEQNSIRFNKQN